MPNNRHLLYESSRLFCSLKFFEVKSLMVTQTTVIFLTWESAPEDTSTFSEWEKARPVILFWWPFNFVLTCETEHFKSSRVLLSYFRQKLKIQLHQRNTSSTRTLYIWIEESSIPMAMILLSWGWNARNVAAGGGGMNVVIVCNQESMTINITRAVDISNNTGKKEAENLSPLNIQPEWSPNYSHFIDFEKFTFW